MFLESHRTSGSTEEVEVAGEIHFLQNARSKDPYVSVRRKVKFQAVTAVWMLGMPRKLLEVIWMLNLDLLKNIYIYNDIYT